MPPKRAKRANSEETAAPTRTSRRIRARSNDPEEANAAQNQSPLRELPTTTTRRSSRKATLSAKAKANAPATIKEEAEPVVYIEASQPEPASQPSEDPSNSSQASGAAAESEQSTQTSNDEVAAPSDSVVPAHFDTEPKSPSPPSQASHSQPSEALSSAHNATEPEQELAFQSQMTESDANNQSADAGSNSAPLSPIDNNKIDLPHPSTSTDHIMHNSSSPPLDEDLLSHTYEAAEGEDIHPSIETSDADALSNDVVSEELNQITTSQSTANLPSKPRRKVVPAKRVTTRIQATVPHDAEPLGDALNEPNAYKSEQSSLVSPVNNNDAVREGMLRHEVTMDDGSVEVVNMLDVLPNISSSADTQGCTVEPVVRGSIRKLFSFFQTSSEHAQESPKRTADHERVAKELFDRDMETREQQRQIQALEAEIERLQKQVERLEEHSTELEECYEDAVERFDTHKAQISSQLKDEQKRYGALESYVAELELKNQVLEARFNAPQQAESSKDKWPQHANTGTKPQHSFTNPSLKAADEADKQITLTPGKKRLRSGEEVNSSLDVNTTLEQDAAKGDENKPQQHSIDDSSDEYDGDDDENQLRPQKIRRTTEVVNHEIKRQEQPPRRRFRGSARNPQVRFSLLPIYEDQVPKTSMKIVPDAKKEVNAMMSGALAAPSTAPVSRIGSAERFSPSPLRTFVTSSLARVRKLWASNSSPRKSTHSDSPSNNSDSSWMASSPENISGRFANHQSESSAQKHESLQDQKSSVQRGHSFLNTKQRPVLDESPLKSKERWSSVREANRKKSFMDAKQQERKDTASLLTPEQRSQVTGQKRKARLPSPEQIPNPTGTSYGMDDEYFIVSPGTEDVSEVQPAQAKNMIESPIDTSMHDASPLDVPTPKTRAQEHEDETTPAQKRRRIDDNKAASTGFKRRTKAVGASRRSAFKRASSPLKNNIFAASQNQNLGSAFGSNGDISDEDDDEASMDQSFMSATGAIAYGSTHGVWVGPKPVGQFTVPEPSDSESSDDDYDDNPSSPQENDKAPGVFVSNSTALQTKGKPTMIPTIFSKGSDYRSQGESSQSSSMFKSDSTKSLMGFNAASDSTSSTTRSSSSTLRHNAEHRTPSKNIFSATFTSNQDNQQNDEASRSSPTTTSTSNMFSATFKQNQQNQPNGETSRSSPTTPSISTETPNNGAEAPSVLVFGADKASMTNGDTNITLDPRNESTDAPSVSVTPVPEIESQFKSSEPLNVDSQASAALARARSKVEKYKPKTPSSLRAFEAMSSPFPPIEAQQLFGNGFEPDSPSNSVNGDEDTPAEPLTPPAQTSKDPSSFFGLQPSQKKPTTPASKHPETFSTTPNTFSAALDDSGSPEITAERFAEIKRMVDAIPDDELPDNYTWLSPDHPPDPHGLRFKVMQLSPIDEESELSNGDPHVQWHTTLPKRLARLAAARGVAGLGLHGEDEDEEEGEAI